MKRTGLSVSIVVAMAGIVMWACGRTTGEELRPELVEGRWYLGINSGRYVGSDTLVFDKDGSFLDRKSVRYSASDSGFDFSVLLRWSASGRWSLRGDTLCVVYGQGKPEVGFDRQSFRIMPTESGADSAALGRLRKEMYDCLCASLRDSIDAGYRELTADTILLGRIVSVTPGELVLSGAGGNVRLVRPALAAEGDCGT